MLSLCTYFRQSKEVQEIKMKPFPPFFTLLNFFSNCFLIHFRFVFDKIENLYGIQQHCKVKKILCIICQLVSMIMAIVIWGEVARSQGELRQDSISPILNIVGTIGAILLNLFLLKLIWFDSQKLLEIGNKFTEFTDFSRTDTIKMNLLVYWNFSMCIIYTLSDKQPMIWIWNGIVSLASLMFPSQVDLDHVLYEHNCTDFSLFSLRSDPSGESSLGMIVGAGILKWGIVLALINCNHFMFASKGVIIALGLSMNQVGKSFERKLQHSVSIDEGIALHGKLKSFQDEINALVHHFILTYYISGLAFFAEAPYLLILRRGWWDAEYFLMIMAYFIHSCFWVLATNYYKTVDSSVNRWIRTMESKPDWEIGEKERLKLLAFGRQVDKEPVGFACSFFTVNYSLVGSMFGIVITYAVLVVQLHVTKSN